MLLASSVHDIKNSLSMLVNSLDEVIDINTLDEQQKHNFSILQSEASRINHALIHLLGLYRLENNQLAVANDEVYVADFLEEQVSSQQLLFTVNAIDVEVHCEEDLTAYFDSQLVAGIITNILVNCAKYTENRIDIYASAQQPGIKIEIIDNGKGYPEHIINNLSNHNRGLDFSSGSTNLGLYFAAEIAQLHKCKNKTGYIALSNRDNGGCFTLVLP